MVTELSPGTLRLYVSFCAMCTFSNVRHPPCGEMYDVLPTQVCSVSIVKVLPCDSMFIIAFIVQQRIGGRYSKLLLRDAQRFWLCTGTTASFASSVCVEDVLYCVR